MMADSSGLTDGEVAEALRSHGSGVEAVTADLAEAVESADAPPASDLDATLFEVLELLAFLTETVASGVEPDHDTALDYDEFAHTAQALVQRLDAGVAPTDRDRDREPGPVVETPTE